MSKETVLNENIKAEILQNLSLFGRLSVADLALLSEYLRNDNTDKINNLINQLLRDKAVKKDEYNSLFSPAGGFAGDRNSPYLPEAAMHRCIVVYSYLRDNECEAVHDLKVVNGSAVVMTFCGTVENQEKFFEIIYVPSGKEAVITAQCMRDELYLKDLFTNAQDKEFNINKNNEVTRRYVVIDNAASIPILGIKNVFAYVVVINDVPYFRKEN